VQFDNTIARLNLTTVPQSDRTALVTSYLNAGDAVSSERLDTEDYCMNFVYDGQQSPYNSYQERFHISPRNLFFTASSHHLWRYSSLERPATQALITHSYCVE
jgi:hypothetical protein